MPITSTGKIRLDNVAVVHPYVLKPNKDGKYACVILIPKDRKDELKMLANEMKKVVGEKWGEQGADKKYKQLKAANRLAVRDGEGHQKVDVQEFYADHYYINCSIRETNGTPFVLVGKRPAKESDTDKFYSGAICNVVFRFWGYQPSEENKEHGQYVSAEFSGIQFVKDGEVLIERQSNVASADDFEGMDTTSTDFDESADLEDAVAEDDIDL